jgi:hypothetical protein
LEGSPIQATVGKYIAGLQITDLQGQRITYGKAFLRRVYSLLSIIPIFIGFFVAGFTAKKQTFHDMLAKTVVIVKQKRSGLILVVIVVVTIILGVLSDKYLGAGFHFSFNSPTTSYNTQTGLQNYVVENGNQVDPTLKNTIITAFNQDKSIYASGDLVTIRQHILAGLPPTQQQQITQVTSMSDSDLKNMVSVYDQIASLATEDVLNSASTTWTFNQDKTVVKISFKTVLSNGNNENINIDMLNTNGQWYF